MDNFELYSEKIKSKSIAVIVHNADKEDDVHVYLGRLLLTHGEYFFVNEGREWKISLNSEQLRRLKPVPDTLKSTLLGADYALTMVIGSLPDCEREGYKKTGMQWHEWYPNQLFPCWVIKQVDNFDYLAFGRQTVSDIVPLYPPFTPMPESFFIDRD